MWLEELDGAEHTEPADVSRKASNIVFFPASKHGCELETRGSPAPAAPRLLFLCAATARCTCAGSHTCSCHRTPPPPQPPPLPPRPRRLSPPVAPLPQEDKLPVRTTAFRGIHITGKTKVSRSQGVILKLFIVLSPALVPSLAVVHFVLPTCNKGTCQPPSHL